MSQGNQRQSQVGYMLTKEQSSQKDPKQQMGSTNQTVFRIDGNRESRNISQNFRSYDEILQECQTQLIHCAAIQQLSSRPDVQKDAVKKTQRIRKVRINRTRTQLRRRKVPRVIWREMQRMQYDWQKDSLQRNIGEEIQSQIQGQIAILKEQMEHKWGAGGMLMRFQQRNMLLYNPIISEKHIG